MRTHSSTPSTKADGFCRLEVITGVGRRRRWTDEDKARIVAGGLVLGSLSALLDLIIVMPVLGHATWHLYRKVVPR